jgi:hypothetical protein
VNPSVPENDKRYLVNGLRETFGLLGAPTRPSMGPGSENPYAPKSNRESVMTSNSLEDFFDEIRANQQANRILYSSLYSVVERLDVCFAQSGMDNTGTRPIVAGVLLARCQYAFKNAAGMALAGQVVEVCPIVRLMLESCGYCLVVCETPALEDVFLARHASDTEMEAQKKAFTIRKIRKAIEKHNRNVADYYEDLYQHTIDFGAHPNTRALFASSELNKHEGNSYLKPYKLSDDPLMIEFALKLTARSGLACLSAMYYVFTHRFNSRK